MDDVQPTPGSEESAHTTGRRSARGQQVEIITRGERRRSWTPEQKCEIVAESLGPELTPTEVGHLVRYLKLTVPESIRAIERAVSKYPAFAAGAAHNGHRLAA